MYIFLNVNINVSINDDLFKHICVVLNFVFIASPVLQCRI